jgi:hypothetical protein
MFLKEIGEMPHVNERAVIINCSTKTVSTLALLSALRYAGMPVLLIDCESKDGSLNHFRNLLDSYRFDLLAAPLRGHGDTLDWLFSVIAADKVLLVDSDVEILNSRVFVFLREYIDEPWTFGAGYVNGPTWIDDVPGNALQGAFLQERIWVPFTLLKVKFIREALGAGISFRARTIYNDLFFSEKLSARLNRIRSRFPAFKRLQTPHMFRRAYYGQTPARVYCDTGAEMLQHLKYERELSYIALPVRFHTGYVTHFGGLTRLALDQVDGMQSEARSVDEIIRQHLRDIYGVVIEESLAATQ